MDFYFIILILMLSTFIKSFYILMQPFSNHTFYSHNANDAMFHTKVYCFAQQCDNLFTFSFVLLINLIHTLFKN